MNVKIGIIGSGFLARTRARCYQKAAGRKVDLVSVVSANVESARRFAAEFGVSQVCRSLEELLSTPIDGVDVCVPNHLHRSMVETAAAAGLPVLCTKPLTAGFAIPDNASEAPSKRLLLQSAVADAEAMVTTMRMADAVLFYGENWIFAPAVRRAVGLLENTPDPLLEMRGWEAHNGSHSRYSKEWRYTGGGALLRLGSHPIGTMLYLKRREGLRLSGVPSLPVRVTAEVKDLTSVEKFQVDNSGVATGWVDVENWGCAIITFSDGSVGVAHGSDVMLGGMESRLELFTANTHLKCNLSPNDMLKAYAPRDSVYDGQYLMEKTSTPSGWNSVMPDEDWSSGQMGLVDAFLDHLENGTSVESDGELGLDVVRTIYSAYVSAEEGRTIEIAR